MDYIKIGKDFSLHILKFLCSITEKNPQKTIFSSLKLNKDVKRRLNSSIVCVICESSMCMFVLCLLL